MPSTTVLSVPANPTEDRRSSLRRRCEQLVYADFGPNNGGILIDIGNGGTRFQCVESVVEGEMVPVSFILTGHVGAIKASAKVVWCNESGKGGGLHFVDLSEEAHQRIDSWISADPLPPTPPRGNAPQEASREKFNLLTGEGQPPAPEPASDEAALQMARLLVSARGSTKRDAAVEQNNAPSNATQPAADPDARPEALYIPDAPSYDAQRSADASPVSEPSAAPRVTDQAASEPSAESQTPAEASPVAASTASQDSVAPEPPAETPQPPLAEASAPPVEQVAATQAVAEPISAPEKLDEISSAAPIPSASEPVAAASESLPVAQETPNEIASSPSPEPVAEAIAEPIAESAAPTATEQPQPSASEAAAETSPQVAPEASAIPAPATSTAHEDAPAAPEASAPEDSQSASKPAEMATDSPESHSESSAAASAPAAAPLRRSLFASAQGLALPYRNEDRGPRSGRHAKKARKAAPRAIEGIPSILAEDPSADMPMPPIPTLGEQILKFAVGVGIGCCLVAGSFVGYRLLGPGHRSFSIPHARPDAVEAAAPAVAQPLDVEVIDLNSRRWRLNDSDGNIVTISQQPPAIELSSGDPSAAPLVPTPTPAAAAPVEGASSAPAVPARPAPVKAQPVRKPASKTMALQRPRVAPKQAPAGDLRAPSLLDGVAPAITAALSANMEPRRPAPTPTPAPAPSPAVAPALLPAPAPAPASHPAAEASRSVFPSMVAAPPEHRSVYKAAVLAERVNPVYPPLAKEQHVTGIVRINAVIGKEGIPHSLRVISGDPRLAPAAIAAVSQWLYHPAQINGEDVESEITISVDFQLH